MDLRKLQDFDGITVNRAVGIAMTPLAPITSLIAGTALVPTILATALFGGLALISDRVEAKARPMVLAVAMIGHCIAFTGAFAGHAWQLDAHMLFFAVLAIIATMGSVPALILAVGITAVHHLGFGLFAPVLVYPSAGVTEVLLRTAMHAGIVIFEAAVLILTMMQSAAAKADMLAAQEQSALAAETAAAAQAEAEMERERAIAAAERTRQESQRAAVAVEQIAATARTAAHSAANATALVARTKHEGEKSNTVVNDAMAAMNAIEESSVQIGQIITVIDEIARQTDLLALNAAVESARAGEAGRGFAVVANEVRKLAQRSADAAQQIRSLVKTSTGRVVEGVGLVGETGRALTRIVAAIGELNDLINGIATGANEQSQGLAQVNSAITRLDSPAGDLTKASARTRRQAA